MKSSSIQPTPFRDLNDVLGGLVVSLRETLRDNFVAAALQGSFAVGDFDVHSDADFIVAVREELDEREVKELQSMHERIHLLDSPWAVHIEGSYFPQAVLRSCSRRGEKLWYLDHGSKELERSGHCNTAVVRRVLEKHGIGLAGVPPRDLVEPVADEILREEIFTAMHDRGREILAHPADWQNRFYQGFIVLNYCRMWCDFSVPSVGSKRRGAEWAKARVQQSWQRLIDRAWATRPDPGRSVREPADKDDYRETLDFLRHVLEVTGKQMEKELGRTA